MVILEKEINGELLNQDTLVTKHKRLVHAICKRFTYQAEKLGVEYEEIVSVGFIGLIKAFQNFDFKKYNVRFSTYAYPMVAGEVQKFLRSANPGIKFSRFIKEIGYRILTDELEQESAEIIAEKLDISKENAAHALNFIFYGQPSSLNESLFKDDSGADITRMDTISSRDDLTRLFVQDFIQSLPLKEQKIVEMLLKGSVQHEIGKEVGISQVQVSRLIVNIGKKWLKFERLGG